MAKDVKYENTTWAEGAPIAGERLATNGHYTGQQKGSVTQDALTVADNNPYVEERNTDHFGTITPDAGDDNFPTVDDGE